MRREMMLLFLGLVPGLQRSHIDREAVLHIGLEQSLVGFVDFLDGDDFDIGGDVISPTEVEHLHRPITQESLRR